MTPLSDMSQRSAPAVVVAWEGPADASIDHRLAAIAALAERLRSTLAAITIPDALLAVAATQVAQILRRHGLRAMPYFDLRVSDTRAQSLRAELAPRMAALDAAQLLYACDDTRYAIAAVNDNNPDSAAIADIRAALAVNGARACIGWVRRTSAYGRRPPALDFALDLPPYGDVPGGGDAAKRYAYPILVSDLARRHAGDDIVVPSVLWSPGSEARLTDSAWVVSEMSSLKIAYAIDVARRFVSNRGIQGAPFWMLRVAFDPGRAADSQGLDDLAAQLQRPHVPSATLCGVALPAMPSSGARIAVVLHLYYPDLWDEFVETVERLPEPFDLFVSCPVRVASALRARATGRFPRAVVFGVHNLGRDVLPFLLWLRTAGAGGYTYVLKLHGKKSAHIVDATQGPFGGGEEWRRQALEGLVGSASHVRAVLKALDAQPGIGLVAPSGQLYDQVTWKCGTADLVATLLARMHQPPDVTGRFPAGTMFWARLSALAPLASLPDAALDFEREAGQVDGTLHHAYERVMALVCSNAGFATTDSLALVSTPPS